ncbi:MAG: hypothetical protein Q8896_06780 [Bacteroidota bacterium]|nr:hypothetical protein [Bacteroidota bacterium]
MISKPVIERVLLFVGLVALSLLVYRSGLHIPYYADDYQRLFTNPDEAMRHAFTKANPFDASYRPLEAFSLGFIQSHWGWDTFPFRLLNLLFHAAGALLVFHALRYWKISTITALRAAVFVIILQMGAAAILGNDTQSQVTGAFFSALSLWLLYRSLESGSLQLWRYAGSIIFFFLALLSKETSSGLALGVAFLCYTFSKKENVAGKIGDSIIKLVPYGICVLAYWLLRSNAGAISPTLGNANLSLNLGANIPINIGLFMIQSVLPISSMAVVKAFQYRDHLLLALIFVLTSAFTLAMFFGAIRSGRKKLALGLVVLLFFSWFPAILLNHIGELYAYNSIFLIGALFGIAFEYYRTSFSKRPVILGVSLLMIIVAFTNYSGVEEKASSMKEQGDRAAIFLPQLISLAQKMPQNEWMYLAGPKDTSFYYSMFRIQGFRVSALSDSVVRFFSGRPDVRVYVADSASCAKLAKTYPGILFTFDPADFRIYPMPESGPENNKLKMIR